MESKSFMSYLKIFIYQFILFSTAIAINFYSDKYISKPFTHIDLIAICLTALIFIPIANLIIVKMLKHLDGIRLRNLILLSIPAFILAILFIGLLTGQIFSLK
jgi:hypothetical protein